MCSLWTRRTHTEAKPSRTRAGSRAVTGRQTGLRRYPHNGFHACQCDGYRGKRGGRDKQHETHSDSHFNEGGLIGEPKPKPASRSKHHHNPANYPGREEGSISVLQRTDRAVGKNPLRNFVYRLFQLFIALSKKRLLRKLNPKPGSRMVDNEVVHASEALVVK